MYRDMIPLCFFHLYSYLSLMIFLYSKDKRKHKRGILNIGKGHKGGIVNTTMGVWVGGGLLVWWNKEIGIERSEDHNNTCEEKDSDDSAECDLSLR